MNELAPFGVDVDRAGVAIGPAVADAENEVGSEHRRVAIAMGGLQSDHAGHQRMVVGDRAPAHQRRNDRHADEFGEFDEQLRRVGVDDPAAGHDERALGLLHHGERLVDLRPRRLRLVDRQRLVGLDVELDLGHLHVERQVDQHRARPAGAHDMEGLLEDARHERRLARHHRPFGDGLGDLDDLDRLEVLLVQPGARRLAGDAQDRDRIRRRRIEAGDHVGAGRPRSADADADVAGRGARIALGHMRGALDVARQDVADGVARLQGRVERVDRRAWHAEGVGDAFALHHQNRRCGRRHPSHRRRPSVLRLSGEFEDECPADLPEASCARGRRCSRDLRSASGSDCPIVGRPWRRSSHCRRRAEAPSH